MIRKFEKDVAVIEKLKSRPNLRDGMTDVELKKKYDEAARLIKEFINEVLIPDIVAGNIPADVTDLGEGAISTVQGAIAALKNQINGIVKGEFPDGSIGVDLLDSEVKRYLYGGVPIPTSKKPELGAYDPGQMWLNTNNGTLNVLLNTGEYIPIYTPVLPVSEGGTGNSYFDKNAILIGNADGGLQAVAKAGNDDAILMSKNDAPQWGSIDVVREALGSLRFASGTYMGDWEASGNRNLTRTISLTVSPKVLFVFNKNPSSPLHLHPSGSTSGGEAERAAVLCAGQTDGWKHHSGNTSGLHMNTARLSGNQLVLAAESGNPRWLNSNGSEYKWVAIY